MSVLAALEPYRLDVEPGATASVTVRVRNLGTTVEKYELTILGTMAPWATVEPKVLRLFPATEGEATVTFAPPRSTQPRAGEHPFAVKVQSTSDQDTSIVEEGDITVGPHVAMRLAASPRVSRGWRQGGHRLTIENLGNAPAGFRVEALDPEERVHVAVQPSEVLAEPGATGVATVSVRPTRLVVRGPDRRWPFTLHVTDPEGDVETLSATFEQRGLLPGWLIAAAGVILALVVAPIIIAWATGGGGQATGSPPGETATATATAIAATDTPPPPTPSPTPEASPTPEITATPEPTIPWPQVPTITIDGNPGLNGTWRANDQSGRDDGGVLVIIITADVHGSTCDLELAWDADLPTGEHPFGADVQGTFICYDYTDTSFSSRGTLYLLERTADSVTGTFDFYADDRAGGSELHLTGGFAGVFIVP